MSSFTRADYCSLEKRILCIYIYICIYFVTSYVHTFFTKPKLLFILYFSTKQPHNHFSILHHHITTPPHSPSIPYHPTPPSHPPSIPHYTTPPLHLLSILHHTTPPHHHTTTLPSFYHIHIYIYIYIYTWYIHSMYKYKLQT